MMHNPNPQRRPSIEFELKWLKLKDILIKKYVDAAVKRPGLKFQSRSDKYTTSQLQKGFIFCGKMVRKIPDLPQPAVTKTNFSPKKKEMNPDPSGLFFRRLIFRVICKNSSN